MKKIFIFLVSFVICTSFNVFACDEWDTDTFYEEEEEFEEVEEITLCDEEYYYEETYYDTSDYDDWYEPESWYMVAMVNANIRSGPGTEYPILDVVYEGETLEIIDEIENSNGKRWCKISDGSFVTAGALIPESEDTWQESEEFENENIAKYYLTVRVNANVRSGPSTSYSIIDGASKGETVGIYYETDGWYYTDKGGFIAASLFYNDCIIISIEKQEISVYKNGECICTSSCVTGTDGYTETPKGEYEILYKERDTILEGRDYRVHVDFWMPFYKGYGLHDASWRDYFGGDIYLESGSHGCVNLPYDVAEFIYYNCYTGTTVIVK